MSKAALALSLLLASACRSTDRVPSHLASRVDTLAFRARFEVVDTLSLEEPGDVLVVNPLVFTDPAGGFLVVENGEEQIRIYSPDGRLTSVIGEGSGRADSLRAPTGVDRLSDRTLVATSLLSSRVAVVPEDSRSSVRSIPTSLRLLEGIVRVTDDHVLLLGPDAPYAKYLLHLWSLKTGQPLAHIFPPPSGVDSNVVLILGRVHVALHAGRLAAVHSLSDTLFLYSTDLTSFQPVPIPSDSFNAPKGALPRITALEKRKQWMDQWTLLSDVFWVDSSHLIIQLAKGRRGRAVYELLQMDTLGTLDWRLPRAPRLLAVKDTLFYFQSANSLTPNHWTVAVQRRAGPST